MIYKRGNGQVEPQSVTQYFDDFPSTDQNTTFVLDSESLSIIMAIGFNVDYDKDEYPYEIVPYFDRSEFVSSVHQKNDIEQIIKVLQDLIA